jgi:hypothetical protein
MDSGMASFAAQFDIIVSFSLSVRHDKMVVGWLMSGRGEGGRESEQPTRFLNDSSGAIRALRGVARRMETNKVLLGALENNHWQYHFE